MTLLILSQCFYQYLIHSCDYVACNAALIIYLPNRHSFMISLIIQDRIRIHVTFSEESNPKRVRHLQDNRCWFGVWLLDNFNKLVFIPLLFFLWYTTMNAASTSMNHLLGVYLALRSDNDDDDLFRGCVSWHSWSPYIIKNIEMWVRSSTFWVQHWSKHPLGCGWWLVVSCWWRL